MEIIKDDVMQAALLSPQLHFKRKALLERLSATIDLPELFRKIDQTPDMLGAGVVYIDSDYTAVELRPFKALCRVKPIKIVLREPPRQTSTLDFAAELLHDKRSSRLVGELVGAGLSCASAILGWIVVLGSSATIPLTGGGSSVITYVAVGAATASSLQCANGLARSGLEVVSPETNDVLDSEEWYQQTVSALDVISLGGAIASGAATVRMVKMLRTSTQKSTIGALKALTRPERRRLTLEIIRLNHPGISNYRLKMLLRRGNYFPGRYSHTEITQAVALQIKDAVGATLTFAGSAFSGTVNALAVGIYEEVAE